MLKLTLTGAENRPVFVNPKAVAYVYSRFDEGTFVQFGRVGAHISVQESAEDVASYVADGIETYGVVDVAVKVREGADEEAKRIARRTSGECKAPAACACEDCIPF